MFESRKLLSAADRFRSMAELLSNPRDARVARQYAAELEQRERAKRNVSEHA
jgi:hypothetical protein